MRKLAKYGWRKDTPDHRDALHRWGQAGDVKVMPPPSMMDTTGLYPEVWDQGNTSSCTGHSGAATACHERNRLLLRPAMNLSRLFLYYGARALGGNPGTDDGAEIRDVFKTLASTGCPREDVWPFSTSLSRIVTQPDHLAYKAATWHKAIKFRQVPQDLLMLKSVIAARKAFSFGFSVYESFEGGVMADSGLLPMPGPNEGQVGAHAVSCAGYDDPHKAFLVRNSWGPGWGQKGYFWMPYDYILNPGLASDFWVVDTMSA